MEKLKMHTPDITEENYQKLAALFPNAVTETVNEDGEVVRAIDADVLRQEISATVVEGKKERYQFTWPDKKKSVVLANQPIAKTLRLNREKSVGRDGTPGKIDTENIYIEGDNLDALKLLQETYLGKVKMIYIDPPYNTGSDAFVYDDDFTESAEEFAENSGAVDENGNRLFDMRVNNESNGRFHTDWLNMMYPRLRLAKDLLADDGVIFISIDDNEQENLKKICDEIFGAGSFRNTILTRRRTKSLNSQFADNGLFTLNVGSEYVLVYAKSKFLMKAIRAQKTNYSEKGRWDVFWSNADRPTMRYDVLGFTPTTGQWRNSKEKADIAVNNYQVYQEKYSHQMTLEEYYNKTGIRDFIRRIPNGIGKNGGVQHWVPPSNTVLRTSNWTDIEVSQIGKEIDLPFNNPKNKLLILELLKLATTPNDLVLDFFSGSATTAHAVMQLNAEDGGHRKFIMVQFPEATADKSEAKKAGYDTICDIGEERIRRAGKKIKEEKQRTAALAASESLSQSEAEGTSKDIDYGFRVFTVDSSNMKDVYYSPQALKQEQISLYADNIKEDRTPEDLLFQVMLDLGIPLSSSIEEREIGRGKDVASCDCPDTSPSMGVAGKKVFSVDGGYLIACFDTDVTEEVVKAIAKEKPFYAVFRDGSMATDSVMTNFEQIFETYSPNTVRKVL